MWVGCIPGYTRIGVFQGEHATPKSHQEVTGKKRIAFTKRSKAIWKALHPVEAQVVKTSEPETWAEPVVPPIQDVDSLGRTKSPQQPKAFAASTAEATELSKATINRALAVPSLRVSVWQKTTMIPNRE